MVGLGEKGNTRRAFADIVSSNYFSVLGVAPAHGSRLHRRGGKPGRERSRRGRQLQLLAENGRDPALLGPLLINGRSFHDRRDHAGRFHRDDEFFRRKSGCRSGFTIRS